MLQPALDDPNPVLIFEHVHALQLRRTSSIPTVTAVDINLGQGSCGRATTSRWSPMAAALFKTLEAAETLQPEGIEAEVIDLRVLRPLDTPTVLGLGGAHPACGNYRRRLEIRVAVGRGRRAHRGRRLVLRPRRADPPRLLARGADAVCRAAGAGGTAAARHDRRSCARVGARAHDRFPHAVAGCRHGSGHSGRMAGEAR